MPLPTITQTVGNHTTTAAPGSIVGTYASTAVGSLLVAVAAVAPSAAPAVATPASWTTGPSVSSTNLGIFTFYFPNNPGAVTAVTFTLTNANGADVTMYEVAGMPTIGSLDLSIASAIATSTTVGTASGFTAVNDEFALGASAWISAAALTQALQPPANVWTAATLQTSTTGATNVVLQSYAATPGTLKPLSIGGTLGGAQFNASILLTFASTVSNQTGLVVAGGLTGTWQPGAYSGSIGGW